VGARSASYWHDGQDPAGGTDERAATWPAGADVVVVGGGLTGTATAYWLARSGARPVLLEQAGLAAGATGRNGGLLVTGGPGAYPVVAAQVGRDTARAVWQFTVRSHALLLEVLDAEGIACDYRGGGHLHLAASEAAAHAGALIAAALAADGFGGTLLDRAQLADVVSTPIGPAIVGGLLQDHSATIHPARLVAGLATAAVRHGAQIVEGVTVTGIEPHAGGLALDTSRGRLVAGRVVVAAGVRSPELLPPLDGLVVPRRAEMLAYRPRSRVFRTACTTDGAGGGFWQQAADGSIVAGAGSATPVTPGLRDAPATTRDGQEAIERLLPALFPELRLPAVSYRWAGWIDLTADGLPVADQMPGLPGCWSACGFSGHGMPFGLRLGQVLAQAVTSVPAESGPPELAPFRLGRSSLREAGPGHAEEPRA
jgi:gamma-glutamylputrescine oxidase